MFRGHVIGSKSDCVSVGKELKTELGVYLGASKDMGDLLVKEWCRLTGRVFWLGDSYPMPGPAVATKPLLDEPLLSASCKQIILSSCSSEANQQA